MTNDQIEKIGKFLIEDKVDVDQYDTDALYLLLTKYDGFALLADKIRENAIDNFNRVSSEIKRSKE